MLDKNWFENWYQKEDPWQYKVTPDDAFRKNKIINVLKEFGPFNRALDIGAGEGYVTESIPAERIHAIEISDLAASRFPANVTRVLEPDSKYDLVMTNGTLYSDYDHAYIANTIKSCAVKYVLVAGVKSWLIDYNFGRIVHDEDFQYREYTQRLIVYEVGSQHR